MNYGARLLRKVAALCALRLCGADAGRADRPRILGRDYASVTAALRWLALLPFLKTFITSSPMRSPAPAIKACAPAFKPASPSSTCSSISGSSRPTDGTARRGRASPATACCSHACGPSHHASPPGFARRSASPCVALDEAAMVEPSYSFLIPSQFREILPCLNLPKSSFVSPCCSMPPAPSYRRAGDTTGVLPRRGQPPGARRSDRVLSGRFYFIALDWRNFVRAVWGRNGSSRSSALAIVSSGWSPEPGSPCAAAWFCWLRPLSASILAAASAQRAVADARLDLRSAGGFQPAGGNFFPQIGVDI